MNITQLAEAVSEFLTPFLPYLLEAGAKADAEGRKQLGIEAYELAKAVWAKLHSQLEANPLAQDTIQKLATRSQDESSKTSLEYQVDLTFNDDPALAREISLLWQEAQCAGVTVIASGDVKLVDDDAVESLVKALSDEDKDVQETAALALGRIGDAPAVEPLIATLRWCSDEDPACAAAWALGKIGDERAVKSLITALVRWPHRTFDEAYRALAKIGDPTIEPVIAALRDSNSKVREGAAEALARIGEARAVGPLLTALEDGDSYVRKAAAEALAKIGDGRAVEPLITALKDEDRVVRGAAAWALGQMADERAIEPLMTALGDREACVRALGGPDPPKALARIGRPAVEPLIGALRHNDSRVRQGAAEALGLIGDVWAVKPLTKRLRDKDGDVRSAAAEALGHLGDARAVKPLIEALQRRDSAMRPEAAEALGKIRDVQAVKHLIAVLRDEKPLVRWIPLRDRSFGEYDRASDARQRAGEALGRIGDRRAVEPLIAALSDRDSDVRHAAAVALGKIGDPMALSHLEQVAREDKGKMRLWPREKVADAAKQAIDRIKAARQKEQ
jgi:HEAT repeat protein